MPYKGRLVQHNEVVRTRCRCCLLLLTEAGDLKLLVNIQLNQLLAELVPYHAIANDNNCLLAFHCGHDAVALLADWLRPVVREEKIWQDTDY
jgi:hypothetical protein